MATRPPLLVLVTAATLCCHSHVTLDRSWRDAVQGEGEAGADTGTLALGQYTDDGNDEASGLGCLLSSLEP